MQVCRYAGVQVCKCAGVQVSHLHKSSSVGYFPKWGGRGFCVIMLAFERGPTVCVRSDYTFFKYFFLNFILSTSII